MSCVPPLDILRTPERVLVPGAARRLVAALYLVVGPLWFSACQSATSPAAQLPTGALAFSAPAAYRTWWSLVESCSGLTGDFNAVQWYQVPGTTTFVVPGSGPANGVWYSNGNIVVLAGDSAQSGQTVRHEMLHSLIGPVSGHPAQYFYTKCGGVVACATNCATEAQGAVPTVDPAAPLVEASTVQLSGSVLPATFATARNEGWLTLVVKVTNTGSSGVRVRLPRVTPGNLAGALFGYTFNGNARFDLTNDAVLYLPAGASRQRAFDVKVTLLDSSARLRGAFAAESTAVITLPPG
jgi:hypothetical protein